jgi:uncharacterized protein
VGVVEQRVSLISLGVDDLPRSKSFYEQLGWRGQEVEETMFFQTGGLAVVLWARDKLADDAEVVPADRGPGFGGIVLAHNVRSAAEVDDVLAAAGRAGAGRVRPGRETFYGGYAGFFTDPDGHVWEVAHNPGFTLETDGSLTLPDFGAT